MIKHLTRTLVVVLVFPLLSHMQLSAQEPVPEPDPNEAPHVHWAQAPHDHADGFFLVQRSSNRGRLATLGKKWQAAEDDEAKEEITDRARELLTKQFEQDYQRREKELEKLEARLEELRELLDKRASNKDEIVDLQLKQTTMGWEGLGWTNGPRSRGGFGASFPRAVTTTIAPAVPGEGEGLNFAIASSPENSDAFEEIVDSAGDMDPDAANTVLWQLYERMQNKEIAADLWRTAAKVAAEAADDIDEDQVVSKSNTYDTAAHLYYMAEDLEEAIKFQEMAVEMRPDEGEFTKFMKKLLKEQKADDEEREGSR